MQTQQLPAGLTNANGEFFVNEEGLPELLQNRSVRDFHAFDGELIRALESTMLQNAKRYRYLQQMLPGADRITEIKQYTHCLHGGWDLKPDIINGVIQEPEYWNCSKRTTCAFQGKVCVGLKAPNGKLLTAREIQYIQLTAVGHLDKNIADIMGISPKTLPKISKQVRTKCGLDRKSDITSFAITNHVV